MSKDDYYVIAARILVFLYSRLKGKEDRRPAEYLCPESEDFPISEEYFEFVVAELERHGYITVPIARAWGGGIVRIDYASMQITQEGIDFLTENSRIRKALKLVPAAAAVIGMFH